MKNLIGLRGMRRFGRLVQNRLHDVIGGDGRQGLAAKYGDAGAERFPESGIGGAEENYTGESENAGQLAGAAVVADECPASG